MPTHKLNIVPVTLDPLPTKPATLRSAADTTVPSCIIKTAETEIFFFNGVDERYFLYFGLTLRYILKKKAAK